MKCSLKVVRMLLIVVGQYTGGSRSEGWEQGRHGCRDVVMSHILRYDAMAHRVHVTYMGHRGLDRSEKKNNTNNFGKGSCISYK